MFGGRKYEIFIETASIDGFKTASYLGNTQCKASSGSVGQ
jgi:hypothetical protein